MGVEGHGGLVRVLRGTNQGFNCSCSVQLRLVLANVRFGFFLCVLFSFIGLSVSRKLLT